jgi:hypothetical protein
MNILATRPSDYWLSVAEAARRSGSTPQCVRMRIRNGQVAALKRYGQWLVNTRSLQAYMQHGAQSKEIGLHASQMSR